VEFDSPYVSTKNTGESRKSAGLRPAGFLYAKKQEKITYVVLGRDSWSDTDQLRVHAPGLEDVFRGLTRDVSLM